MRPRLANTGSELPKIVASLLDYSDWLYGHDPDVALVSTFCAPESQCEEAHLHDFHELTSQHQRAYETFSSETSITVVSTHGDEVSARADQHLTEQDLVDSTGKLIDRKSFSSPTSYLVVIVKEPDGKWYLASVNQVARSKQSSHS